ncbi:MAG: helix-turn-helix domain-containing protein [Oscillospiraceae bacterium]|nr:helix-turn-helix domain-containing protein [Oscillospiraceae bacterium]
MTYWERFENLCKNIGKKPNPVGKEIGVSSSTITKWKNGAIPNGEILLAVSNYFNCSIDYLLGRTTTSSSSTNTINNQNTIKESDIRRIERARNNMSFQERERMMNIIEAAFPEYFSEDFIDEDIDE